jgi:hypothetical protein
MRPARPCLRGVKSTHVKLGGRRQLDAVKFDLDASSDLPTVLPTPLSALADVGRCTPLPAKQVRASAAPRRSTSVAGAATHRLKPSAER